MSQLIFGFDTSLTHFGYAVAEANPGDIPFTRWLAVGCITPKTFDPKQRRARGLTKTSDTQRRVEGIAVELRALIARHGTPEAVAVEALVLGMRSTRATISALGRVRGLVDAMCAEFDLEAKEFSPQALKKGVTGTNDAEKSAVAARLVELHPTLEGLFAGLSAGSVEHAADACAAIHAALNQEP